MDSWETGSYSASYGSDSTYFLNYNVRVEAYQTEDKETVSRLNPMIPPETTSVRSNIPKAIGLLDQIIDQAKEDDELQKAYAIKVGKGSQAIGESWMVFHLKALKGLLSA